MREERMQKQKNPENPAEMEKSAAVGEISGQRPFRKAIIGLGANLDAPKDRVLGAIECLNNLIDTKVTGVSSLYRTKPEGYATQPDYINAVAQIRTKLSPAVLLGALLGIESAMGRKRSFENAPRRIDLDLLLYEGYSDRSPEITVPHPLMRNRAFVLIPMLELFPHKIAIDYNFSGDLHRLDKSAAQSVQKIG